MMVQRTLAESSSRTRFWQCIYCFSASKKQFPAEHVIPRAFGMFSKNLTVHCVCDECNNFFSGNLEIHFARETGEGIVRYRHGLRDSPAPGAESDVFIAKISVPGPLFGLQVRLTPNASKDGLGFDWITQVGFEEKGTSICRWFTEDRLTPEFLKDVNFGSKVCFAVPNRADWTRLRAKLISLGFKLGDKQEFERVAPKSTFDARVQWTFDMAIRRCVAKVAFNHLAYITGQRFDFLGGSDFDEVRNYIRHGVNPDQHGPGLVLIDSTEAQLGFSSPAPVGGGHLIVTAWDATNCAIISHLSIFGALGYRVILCRNYGGVWFDILKGHYFDLSNRQAREVHLSRQMSMTPVLF